MTDRPIICPAWKVPAFLNGATQIRMPAWQETAREKCYGHIKARHVRGEPTRYFMPTIWQSVEPGDRLWVRETMKVSIQSLIYVADQSDVPKGSFAWQDWLYQYGEKSIPSVHMPRWASRLTLIVTDTRLAWTQSVGATGYDVVRGDLDVLHGTDGDFTAATEECLADDHPTTLLTYGANPGPGEAHWFLVRTVTTVGNGSYNSTGSMQVGLRDAEIDASPNAFS